MASIEPKFKGFKPVWGIPEHLKALSGVPGGRHRLRFRSNQAGVIFIKTAVGIEQWILEDLGTHWRPLIRQGKNLRIHTGIPIPSVESVESVAEK